MRFDLEKCVDQIQFYLEISIYCEWTFTNFSLFFLLYLFADENALGQPRDTYGGYGWPSNLVI